MVQYISTCHSDLCFFTDLREDGYLAHHMGYDLITTSQVCSIFLYIIYLPNFMLHIAEHVLTESQLQGEELRKQIGAAAYIECSSRTQQVIRESYLLTA